MRTWLSVRTRGSAEARAAHPTSVETDSSASDVTVTRSCSRMRRSGLISPADWCIPSATVAEDRARRERTICDADDCTDEQPNAARRDLARGRPRGPGGPTGRSGDDAAADAG